MKQSVPVKCVVCAIALVAAAAQAKADDWLGGWVHLYPQHGELTLDFDGRRETVDDGTTTDLDLEEKVRFRQDGYVLDPGIATFSVDTAVIFEQGWSSGYDSDGDTSGLFADYNLRASVLHGSTIPVNANGGATRNSGSLDNTLGSRTEFLNETRDFTVNYRNAYLPSSIGYSERHTDQEFLSGLASTLSETADTLRTVRYNGRSRKMNLTLDHNWFNDRAPTTNNDYNELNGVASHNFRWGKGSNLNSRWSYRNRAGFRKRRNLEIRESGKIRHSSKVESFFDYSFLDEDADIDTVTNEGSVRVVHRLYNNLTTDLDLSGSLEDTDFSETQEYDAKLDFEYRKKVVWDGLLTASLGSGYGITDRVSIEGALQTFDESHTVGASLIVTLTHRYIDSATIIVTNQAGNIVYTAGTDYNVVSAAENRTELEILAAGGISNGDTILVDYSFQTLPTLKYSRIPYNFRVGLDFGWVSAFQSFRGKKESLISGPDDSSLNDQFEMMTGTELRWKRQPVETTFSAKRRYWKSGSSSTESISLNQSLNYTMSREATVYASAIQDFTTSSTRDYQTFSIDAWLNWRPMRGLTVKPGLRAWSRQSESETGDTSEAFIRGDVSVNWRVRQIVLSFLYSHDHRTGTVITSDEDRIRFTVTRRF